MKDFFQYRESLTEARKKPVKKKPTRKAKKPVKRNGEDYSDNDLGYEWERFGRDSMVTYVKVADIKKLNKNSVEKMSSKERQEIYDLLQDDYEMLGDLASAFSNEVRNLEDWLDDAPSSERRGIGQDIKYLQKQET